MAITTFEGYLSSINEILHHKALSSEQRIILLRSKLDGVLQLATSNLRLPEKKMHVMISALYGANRISKDLKDRLFAIKNKANSIVHENAQASYSIFLELADALSELLVQVGNIDRSRIADPIRPDSLLAHMLKDWRAELPDQEAFFDYGASIDYLRGTVLSFDATQNLLIVDLDKPLNGKTEHQVMPQTAVYQTWNHWLKRGDDISLVSVEVGKNEDGEMLLLAKYLIYMPDYLVDVTTAAKLLDSKGNFIPFIIKSWLDDTPTNGHLILGNAVNKYLDARITSTDFDQDFQDFLEDFIAKQAIDENKLEVFYKKQEGPTMAKEPEMNDLKSIIRDHAHNIEKAIANHFVTNPDSQVAVQFEPHIRRQDSFVEPTFIAPRVGLKGRVDLLHIRSNNKEGEIGFDVVELKSGNPRSVDDRITNNEHKSQAMAYQIILKSIFGFKETVGNVKVLYSQSDRPVKKVYFDQTDNDIQINYIALRNSLVKFEMDLAMATDLRDISAELIAELAKPLDTFPNTVNQLKAFGQLLGKLDPQTANYYSAWLKFTFAEQLFARIGNPEDEQPRGIALLWQKPRLEKLLAGEVIEHMTLVEGSLTGKRIRFRRDVPYERSLSNVQGQQIRPIFRVNDRVILYPEPVDEVRRADPMSPVLNQVIKANIAALSEDEIELSFNHDALNLAYFTSAQHWAIERDTTDNSVNAWLKAINRLPYLDATKRQLILGQALPPERTKTDWPHDGFAGEELSDEQKSLLSAAVASSSYYLLMGPPGTGKTRFMLKNLAWYYYQHTQQTIWIVAFTNRAVDEICEQLEWLNDHFGKASAFDYVRVGHHLGTAPQYHNRLVSDRVRKMHYRECEAFVNNLRIVVGTASSMQSAGVMLALKPADVLIVDEASQMLEPQMLPFVTRVPKFILIGDHKQLPAVVVQPESYTVVDAGTKLHDLAMYDMRNSYFERLWTLAEQQDRHDLFGTLTRQGRMHHDIGRFVSEKFYDSKLNVATEGQRAPLKVFWGDQIVNSYNTLKLEPVFYDALNVSRVVFIALRPENVLASQKSNYPEAQLVADLVLSKFLQITANLTQLDVFDPTRDIGVIAPFRNQVALIEQRIEELAISLAMPLDGLVKLRQITVDTVERYQGSQRKLIIVSCTVMAPYQMNALQSLDRTGLVDRKLNVAISRAQQQIVVIGNDELLGSSAHYADLMAHAKNHGQYIDLGTSYKEDETTMRATVAADGADSLDL